MVICFRCLFLVLVVCDCGLGVDLGLVLLIVLFYFFVIFRYIVWFVNFTYCYVVGCFVYTVCGIKFEFVIWFSYRCLFYCWFWFGCLLVVLWCSLFGCGEASDWFLCLVVYVVWNFCLGFKCYVGCFGFVLFRYFG